MHDRHPGLPVLYDAFRTRDGIVQIVMELMQGLNICSFVASSHQYFEDQARIVFRDITGERLMPGSERCMPFCRYPAASSPRSGSWRLPGLQGCLKRLASLDDARRRGCLGLRQQHPRHSCILCYMLFHAM